MQGFQNSAVEMQADPNVTPMIDVLLVLLIIFMMIIPISRRAVDVQLPAPEAVGEEGSAIVLEVFPGGRLALNQQPLALAELGAKLRTVYSGRPEKVIMIRGDGAVRYPDVVTASDFARGAGVLVVGIDPQRSNFQKVH